LCGIFGCLLAAGEAAPRIRAALQRLEYRGYDSVGIATRRDGALHIKKDVGQIEAVHAQVDLDALPGRVGIGHTRWATHGAPLRENAHPHVDCTGRVAVVHNGIIDNYAVLKAELEGQGHVFASKTDTEVVAHLVEAALTRGQSFEEGCRAAVARLEGSFALVVLAADGPPRLFCARRESPLVLGVSDGGTYVSSDVAALLPLTDRVVYLRNGDGVVVSPAGLDVRRLEDWTPVQRAVERVSWTVEMAQKQGYSHYMLKEIHEQPVRLRDGLRLQDRYLDLLTRLLDRSRAIFLVACGTSYNACLAASYMFSRLCNLTAIPVVASEFIAQYGGSIDVDSTILAVSQSGETADMLHAIDVARFRGATILGLTNTIGSTLTRVSRAYLCQQSGPEIGVAASKTFTSQLLVLAQLALRLAKLRGKVSQDAIDDLERQLDELPDVVATVLQQDEKIQRLAMRYRDRACFYFLGRGINLATALEGKLKLLEISYIPALGYPAGESKHGPISLVEAGFPVVFICPRDETRKALVSNVMEMKARGADVIAVVEEGDQELKALADDYVEIPAGVPDVLTPIPYALPLQLFAYYMALERKCDPDKPRNLAKSVTVL
jgi:glucosamine--fructose-6-phosphate aminotransferase (isomerizing)